MIKRRTNYLIWVQDVDKTLFKQTNTRQVQLHTMIIPQLNRIHQVKMMIHMQICHQGPKSKPMIFVIKKLTKSFLQ
jgi:hypothetical protein